MADQSKQPALSPKQIVAYKQLVERAYAGILDAIDKLDSEVGVTSDRRWKDQLALYKQNRDERFTLQTNTVLAYPDTDPFWSDKDRMKRVIDSMQLFIDQIKATTVGAGISFWDGFLDTLGNRAAEIYKDFPSPLVWLKWLPWVIGGAIVLPPLLRSFSAYKRGGAAAAADEAAGSIERGRSAAASAVATGARKLATRGMAGAPRRRRSMRSR
jgi:hypothetical protein